MDREEYDSVALFSVVVPGEPHDTFGTMPSTITLYVKTGCPYCATKRRELSDRGLSFTEVNVTDHPEVIPELLKLTKGKRLVPVVVDGARISVAPEGG